MANFSSTMMVENTTSDTRISKSLMVQVSAYCVVFVVSFLGNLLVILTIKKDQNELKKLVMSATICHMAIADSITTIVGLPFMIVRILNGGAWLIEGMFGLVVCKIHSFAIEVGFAVSANSIAVIALERFLSVFFPLRKILSVKSAHAISLAVWIGSCAFYSPKLYSINVFKYKRKLYCVNKLELIKPWRELEAISYAVLFLVTLSLYVAIIVKIQRRSSVPGRAITESSQQARNRRSRKVIRQGLGVITIHYLCWLPYLVVYLSCAFLKPVPGICRDKNIFMTFLIFFFGYSNAALNPILYTATNESFRKGCRAVLRNFKISCTSRILPLASSSRCAGEGGALSIAKTSSDHNAKAEKRKTSKITKMKNSLMMERVERLDTSEDAKENSDEEKKFSETIVTS